MIFLSLLIFDLSIYLYKFVSIKSFPRVKPFKNDKLYFGCFAYNRKYVIFH